MQSQRSKMQYYPQHYYGFAVDNNIAEKLQLNEAFDNYEMSYEENDFFDGFEEKYGIEPYKFAKTSSPVALHQFGSLI